MRIMRFGEVSSDLSDHVIDMTSNKRFLSSQCSFGQRRKKRAAHHAVFLFGTRHCRIWDDHLASEQIREILVSVHTPSRRWIGIADVSPCAVIRVAELIWGNPNHGPIMFMKSLKPCNVGPSDGRVCNGKSTCRNMPRPRIFAQWMEVEVVHDFADEILSCNTSASLESLT